MAKQDFQGKGFSPAIAKQVEETASQGNKTYKTHLLNHKNAHLGLSVPAPLTMGTGVGKNKTGFNKHFEDPVTGKLSGEPQDREGLRNNPGVKLMAARMLDAAENNVSKGNAAKALAFYPEESAGLANIGKQFNAHRAAAGKKEYLPETPELAGTAISAGYSKGNSERNRRGMIKKATATGELPKWNNVDTEIERAIQSGTHPLNIWNEKLRDFAGSLLHPETWNGEHEGVKRGTGHTEDRHIHDTQTGRDFGDTVSPELSGKGTAGERRYRTHQVATELAHEQFTAKNADHPVLGKLSAPQFQSLGWTGHDSAAQYQA